jgi:hypothetical protein
MTPFEAYYGFKPDLRNLRVFGARVCVKRTGKRRSKLNRHDFTGIFLGLTATDENFKYIDVNTRIEKTLHHGIFDEAWYLQLGGALLNLKLGLNRKGIFKLYSDQGYKIDIN